MTTREYYPAEWDAKDQILWVGEWTEGESYTYATTYAEPPERANIVYENEWLGDDEDGANLAEIINSEHDLREQVARLTAENADLEKRVEAWDATQ